MFHANDISDEQPTAPFSFTTRTEQRKNLVSNRFIFCDRHSTWRTGWTKSASKIPCDHFGAC